MIFFTSLHTHDSQSTCQHVSPKSKQYPPFFFLIYFYLKFSFFCRKWNPREFQPLLSMLEAWQPALVPWIVDNILDQLVLPRLLQEVENWNPLTDTMPIHSWLHPWLPLMGKMIMIEEQIDTVCWLCDIRVRFILKSLCECGQADQTSDHILQSCPRYAERRQLVWLWGSAEDLYRTAGFVASTRLQIWRLLKKKKKNFEIICEVY